MYWRKVNQEELDEIIRNHGIWLNTNGNRGKRAILKQCNFDNLKFHNVDLSYADISDSTFCLANISQSDFSGAILEDSFFSNVNIIGSYFCGSNLIKTKFQGAHISSTNFDKCNLLKARLEEANFINCSLDNANLSETFLIATRFQKVSLIDTNFNYSGLGGTIFANVDLSSVIGLTETFHYSHSSVDFDTIKNFKGVFTIKFMQGVGLPDSFIEYAASFNNKSIPYYSCFISYSSKDEVFAKRLHADLQTNGIRCWFAPEDLKIGQKIRTAIDQSIRIHDKLLIVLSENSINSGWVEKEVETAFEKEMRLPKDTVLFPIRIDSAVMKTDEAWATDIKRTRHIGDFTNWKDYNKYRKSLKRLLRDLKGKSSDNKK